MRHIGFLLINLLLVQVCNSQSSGKTDWVTDIDFLGKELPARHKDFFTVKDKNSFLAGLERIKSRSANLLDFEVWIQLQQLTASFGDSHTKINYGDLIKNSKRLPLHLYWFSDGLYVLHTTQENVEILGHQILAVNGVPIKIIADSLTTLTTVENDAVLKIAVPELLPRVQLLQYFGFVKEESVELTLRDLSGKTKSHIVRPAELTRKNRKSFEPDSLTLCFKYENKFFIDYLLAATKTYYLQYNKCWSKELELQHGDAKFAELMPSFGEFENRVFQTLKDKAPERLVFDLRFNGGGNSSQGTNFIKKLSKYLEQNSKVKMFVVVGRHTFSSAIINALDFKKLTNAVFVGEETAGKPNHFGEIKSIKLPSSGLQVNYSTKYFKLTDQAGNTFSPDVKLETSFQDFKAGVDPAYEWIIKH